MSHLVTTHDDPGPTDGPPSARQPAVSLEHVWAAYERTDALQDVSLRVDNGDFVALIGPNGGGKTTLLKLLVGLLRPLRGTIHVLGSPVDQARREVGYVPQDIRFDRDFPVTAWEVARMGRLGRRGLLERFTSRDAEIVDEALRRVNVGHLRDRPIGTLSGGERQRVYIARALASQPQVLLLDEPLANVDPDARGLIQEVMSSLAHQMTILMSTHDVGALLPAVDKVGYLNRDLVFFGRPCDAPLAIRENLRCPAEATEENLAAQDRAHHHEVSL